MLDLLVLKRDADGTLEIEPGSSAAMLMWENVWAGTIRFRCLPFRWSAVDSGRIPIQALLAAVEAEQHDESEAVAESAINQQS